MVDILPAYRTEFHFRFNETAAETKMFVADLAVIAAAAGESLWPTYDYPRSSSIGNKTLPYTSRNGAKRHDWPPAAMTANIMWLSSENVQWGSSHTR